MCLQGRPLQAAASAASAHSAQQTAAAAPAAANAEVAASSAAGTGGMGCPTSDCPTPVRQPTATHTHTLTAPLHLPARAYLIIYALPNTIPSHARAMGAGVGSTVGDPI